MTSDKKPRRSAKPKETPSREAMELVFKHAVETARIVHCDPAYDWDHMSVKLVRKHRPKEYRDDAGLFWTECFRSALCRLDTLSVTASMFPTREEQKDEAHVDE